MSLDKLSAAQYHREGKIRAEGEAKGLSEMLFGKVPPQALQLEEAVLGALMLDNSIFETVNEILRAESFYTECNQVIYKAISELSKNNRPIDLLTVTEELRRMGAIETIGGSYHLVELTNRVGSTANVEYHARIIAQKEVLRAKILACTQTITECYSEELDPFDILQNDAIRSEKVEEIPNRSVQNDSLMDAALELIAMVIQAQKGGILGVPSGLIDLDKILNGHRHSKLYIYAGRPSMGKTGFMCKQILEIAEQGLPVVVASIEMPSYELLGRLATAKSGIANDKLEGQRNLTKEEYELWYDALQYILTLKIHINDSSTQSVNSIRTYARKIIKMYENKDGKFVATETRKGLLGMIWVDYLQLMTPNDVSKGTIREQEVAAMSKGLKALSKQLKTPVGALAQLSRAVETRGGNKKPMLSDLRESGSIEQDADVISFIYRPEYYEIIEDENGATTFNQMQVIVSKNRGGALGTAKLNYDRTTQRIRDWGDYYEVSPATPPKNIITRESAGIRNSLGEGTDESFTLPTPSVKNEDLPF